MIIFRPAETHDRRGRSLHSEYADLGRCQLLPAIGLTNSGAAGKYRPLCKALHSCQKEPFANFQFAAGYFRKVVIQMVTPYYAASRHALKFDSVSALNGDLSA